MLAEHNLGIGGMSTHMIKSVAFKISLPLAIIFNFSLSTCIFPTQLKTSQIAPILKTGDSESCDHY
jgi:hypothetical protein